MEGTFLALIIITILFFILLAVKEILGKKLKEKVCVICGAVALTWFSLLILYYYGIFEDNLVIALLLGESSLGVFYLAEKKIKEEFKIFRLPFLLTLIAVAYFLISLPESLIEIIGFLVAVWLAFGLIYIFRKNESLKSLTKKIMECCKNW